MRAIVDGRVLRAEDGSGIANAEIRYEVGDALSFGVARSDARGAFRFEARCRDVPEAGLQLEVRATARALLRKWPHEQTRLTDGAAISVDLTMAEGRSVCLDVVDADGRPVGGACSRVVHHDWAIGFCGWPLGFWIPSGHPEEPRTDMEGRLWWHGFPMPPYPHGRYLIAIAHPRYEEALIDVATLAYADGVARHRVVLAAGRTLVGRVRGQGGTSLSGAKVAAWHQDPDAPPCHVIEQSAEADESGHYRLPGLRSGQHILAVTHAEHRERRETLTIEEDRELDFTIETGAVLEGSVIGADGKPAAGVQIIAQWEQPTYGTKETETDTAGGFSLAGLPDAEVDLFVQRPDDRGVIGCGRVRADEGKICFDARELAELSGTLVDETGAPLERRVLSQARMEPFERPIWSDWHEAPDGSFAVRVPAGVVALFLAALDDETNEHHHARAQVTLVPGEKRGGVTLLAIPCTSLTVKVVRAGDGAPVIGAGVDVMAEHPLMATVRTGTTDGDGRVHFDHVLANDPLRVTVGAEGYRRGRVRNVIAPSLEPVVIALEPSS